MNSALGARALLVGSKGGTSGGGGSASSPIRERRCYEAAELQLLRRREPMPTNEASFVNHPLYCLKKHLRRNQVIIGEQSCGLFKGQPVYSRALVEEAMSAVQWKKLCRTVKEDQLCQVYGTRPIP